MLQTYEAQFHILILKLLFPKQLLVMRQIVILEVNPCQGLQAKMENLKTPKMLQTWQN